MKYHRNSGRNGGVNKFSNISIKDFHLSRLGVGSSTTPANKQDQPISLNVSVVYNITSGAATSGAGSNHAYNFCYGYGPYKDV